MNKVRVRFAPSPTGNIHVGNMHTTLFNWLFCRNVGGTFVLRLEDTDVVRSEKKYEDIIYEDIKWLGLNWDEGPDIGGPHKPYRQSERLEIYQIFAERLLLEGKCYRCYCSEEEIGLARAEAYAKGENPLYGGRCRDLSEEEERHFINEGRVPSLRFKVPENKKIVIDDIIRGPIEFDTREIGDFIIVRSNNMPIYNFAVVVDDITMEITHIVRGDEHISNTPVQILIYQALGAPLPKFAHASIVLGEDRTKLSKRKHSEAFVGQFRELGYLPEALVNFLALIGWAPSDGQEVHDLSFLISDFSLGNVAKSPAIFSMDKLKWLNSIYIKKAPVARITDLALGHLDKAGLYWNDRAWLEKCVGVVVPYLSFVGEIAQHISIFFAVEMEEEAKTILLQNEATSVVRAFVELLEQHFGELTADELKPLFKEAGIIAGVKGKGLFQPLRTAITGKCHGPELPLIIDALGKEATLDRLKKIL
ncbi:MAG: glutamate--tRNA ligase [bacterium]|nr:glutamate--tRNA ligase [bacterium]